MLLQAFASEEIPDLQPYFCRLVHPNYTLNEGEVL